MLINSGCYNIPMFIFDGVSLVTAGTGFRKIHMGLGLWKFFLVSLTTFDIFRYPSFLNQRFDCIFKLDANMCIIYVPHVETMVL